MGDEFTFLFDDQPLEFEIEDERNEYVVIGDETVNLLQYKNRFGLARRRSRRVIPATGGEPGRVYLDVPLMCVIHPDPRCRFTWSRLEIDLSPTSDAEILDMVPREVRGERPVELKTTIGVELKFAVASLTPERTDSRTVYFPEIVSSGVGFNVGYWDFLALGGEYLHANRELRLLVGAPAGIPIAARFFFQARAALAGFAGHIPLLARRGAIEETYRLD
ncbi:MAG: hypothetical protein N2378_12590 [Chloroflexaceae bacterium]|nr:hypothetical protein [Chloroflexaceae bacterium]